jgi:surface antigen
MDGLTYTPARRAARGSEKTALRSRVDLCLLLVAALGATCVAPAQALPRQSSLQDTPEAKFNADDLALMRARVAAALKSEKDGVTFDWKNDKTGASGSVVPLERLTWNGLACRRLRIANSLGEFHTKGVYKFCEKPPGRWKLAGPEKE